MADAACAFWRAASAEFFSRSSGCSLGHGRSPRIPPIHGSLTRPWISTDKPQPAGEPGHTLAPVNKRPGL